MLASSLGPEAACSIASVCIPGDPLGFRERCGVNDAHQEA